MNDKLYLVNESVKVQTGSKSYKVDGDQEELRTVDSGDAQSLPAIYCHEEYVLH